MAEGAKEFLSKKLFNQQKICDRIISMTFPTGKANPEDQKRIEELRQHIQELIDEMAFYQIRWDSLAREGNVDAARELRYFDEGFSELEAEVMDLQNQLHALEYKSGGDQAAFVLPEEPKPIDRREENHDLVALQRQEQKCIEEIAELREKEVEGEDVGSKLSELHFRADYLRKEINDIYGHQ